MPETRIQLPPLTGMRFFLALWVVVYHQPFFNDYSWMSAFPAPLPKLFHTGYLAVGIFFALSGFVLAHSYSLEKPWQPRTWKRFGIARFARIYPAYAIGLLLSIPWVVLYLVQHFSLLTVFTESIKAVLTWTLLQSWIPQTAEGWNGPGWSLSVECFFYCCFPLVGVALWKLSRTRTLLAAGFLIWAASLVAPLVAVSLGLLDKNGLPASSWFRESSGPWVNLIKFSPLLQLPQFCMGIVTGRLYHLIRSTRPAMLGKGYWLYLPGLLLEVLAITQFQASLFVFLHNGLLLPLHSLVILGFALDGGPLARFLSTPLLVLLGNASYSMYIFHMPVAGWISTLGKRLFSKPMIGMDITLIYMVFLVGFSTAAFKLVEEPLNRILKNRLNAWVEPPNPQVEMPSVGSAGGHAAVADAVFTRVAGR